MVMYNRISSSWNGAMRRQQRYRRGQLFLYDLVHDHTLARCSFAHDGSKVILVLISVWRYKKRGGWGFNGVLVSLHTWCLLAAVPNPSSAIGKQTHRRPRKLSENPRWSLWLRRVMHHAAGAGTRDLLGPQQTGKKVNHWLRGDSQKFLFSFEMKGNLIGAQAFLAVTRTTTNYLTKKPQKFCPVICGQRVCSTDLPEQNNFL